MFTAVQIIRMNKYQNNIKYGALYITYRTLYEKSILTMSVNSSKVFMAFNSNNA